MRNNLLIMGLVAVAAFVVLSRNEQVVATDDLDRTRLPIAQPAPAPVTEVLPENVPLPTPWEVKAPEGAPNVVIVLLDDIGFGGPSPFGGPINMPTLQKLADNGLGYNRFHTIALCALTRAALKTGRNHHQVNMGSIPEIATGYAGNTTVVPDNAAPIAEVLRQNGFATGAFGKWHETPSRETTAGGPQTRWPTRQGFEKFYGFLGAEENMYEPSLHDGVTIIDTPQKPDYHLLEDMTDQAIAWVREQKSMRPDKPFFIYYSSAGSHAPHQVNKEWIAKYEGKFDQGWDAVRNEVLQAQIREQFTHVIDVVPTILEATGIPEPTVVDGVPQIPIQGTSMMYSFDHANAPERHTKQYFEIIGNRGLYQDGWLARTTVKLPWETVKMNTVANDDGWELYNTLEDFSLANNLADQYPERLEAMRATFMEEAIANQVLPLDDRLLERLLPAVAGRPTIMAGRTTLDLYPGAKGLDEDAVINMKNTSGQLSASVTVAEGQTADGIIIAQGSRFGGWTLYVEDGYAAYTYNNLGDLVTVKSDQKLSAGDSDIRLEISYDGGGIGKGADLKLLVNNAEAATGRLDTTIASRFSIDEGTDIGMDRGAPVLKRQLNDRRYSEINATINKVTLEIAPEA